MIHINLASKKKSSLASGGSGGGSDLGGSLRSLSSGESAKSVGMLVFRLGLPVALGLGANYGFDSYVEQKQAEMALEIKNIDDEKAKIVRKLNEYKGFEEDKRRLEQNQVIIRNKIDTIEKLIRNRDFTPKALINLAQAVPSDVWLTEVTQSEKAYNIRGSSMDAGLVSDFMTKLQKNIYFKDVQLKSSVVSDPTSTKSDFELAGKGEE
jgi:Tfp pilus assembly protein PilN